MRIVETPGPVAVDENRVVERVLGGDAEAFSHFVRAYQKRIYGMALRLLRDPGEAECVAQETFLNAFRALADFRGGSRFETWLTRIAINRCRDRLKRKRLVVYFHQSPAEPEPEEAADRTASASPGPDRLMHAKEIRRRLRDAIAALSPRQRIVFVLKHLEEKSIPEIADLLQLDSGTVKSHLFRAANKIRARLRDLAEEQ